MELGLGTAQFGLDYGISNTTGKVPADTVGRILYIAHENGIRVLDTAPSYGDSECALGSSMPPEHRFRVITKLPPLHKGTITHDDIAFLKGVFSEYIQ